MRSHNTPFPTMGPAPAPAPETTRLQPMAWPEPALCSERTLFMRLHGRAAHSQSTGEIAFQRDAHVQFDTYFNVFNIGKWHTHCGLTDLGLQLRGTGQIELTIWITYGDRSWGRLVNEVVTLEPQRTLRFDVPLAGQAPERGVVFWEFRALGAGTLSHAAWDTRQAPRRRPNLALAVTTFQREEAVRQTIDRFDAFAEGSPLKDHLHMIVVDNGASLQVPPSPRVTLLENENLGGAGGFARGLLEARARGFSHCLFMDDDAATPMDAIERTWTFLAYARDPATAIAGAMVSTRHAWALWENGALFDGACRPLFGGTDLRDPGQVMAMEYASTPRNPHNFYGGWWYFAFALDAVHHLPFPFFVRGDDVSFSIVHDFNIVTLPGVVSFQESFTEKDTPLTWYLDMRSHLAHHLSLPSMDIGRRATVRMGIWFWARTLLTCHYETMVAVRMAIEDVMRGPQFFAETADLSIRRAQLGALRDIEQWQPCAAPA
ncbi:glycosyltransferase family 2 protein [Roseobacteraceae bacterium S113]